MSIVLAIGDTHCPGMKSGYIDFLKRIADRHNVDRVVHIGDLVDWASISYHEKSPSLSNATSEFFKARKQIAQLQTNQQSNKHTNEQTNKRTDKQTNNLS